MKLSIRSTAMLLGRPHAAVRSLSLLRDTYDDQAFESQSKKCGESTGKFQAKPSLRLSIRTTIIRRKGGAADDTELAQVAIQDKTKEPKRQYIWSRIVKNLKAKAAIVKCGTQRLFKKAERNSQTSASLISTEWHSTTTRSVQYRDIDLGSRREAIYADTLVDLSDNDQILDSNFGLSSWGLSYSGQDEEFLHEVLSGTDISRWKDLQHTISQPREDRSARATYYEPLPPLSIIDENVQEDSSRPTTSSTNRRDSGEFLRCLQTSSSLASMLHSRNVSEASAITLPSSKDDYELRTAPGGEGPSKLDRLSLCEAENLRSTYASVVVQSHFDHGMGQDVVDTDDVFEDNVWLQAPMYQEPESYEEEDNFEYDFHGSMVLNTEEAQVANNRRKCDEELYFDHQSQKSLCLHVEQSAAGEDDQSYSYSSQTPNGREEVVTRSYGKFDAAFTQQIKDYSKLLDDLADPDATEQALELVSRRLSIYLNTNSSADSGFGRPFETEIPHEKRQLMDLSGLDAFLDDDDDDDEEYSDSGFQAAGGGGSITRIFACPAQPQSTPFFDLEQFIDDDDLDFDMGSGGPDKPVTNGFDDWESSVDGDV